MFRCYETAAVMARFGPWIRVKHKGLVDGAIRQDIKQVAHIASVKRHIGARILAQFAQKHRHTVQIGLAANDLNVRVQSGLMMQMLAAAKTHLQPKWSLAKPRHQIEHLTFGIVLMADRSGAQRV